jgi:hypothetical protein
MMMRMAGLLAGSVLASSMAFEQDVAYTGRVEQ